MKVRPANWLLMLTGVVLLLATGLAWAGPPDGTEQKMLFRRGAQLWPQTCGNCHKPRPGGERSPVEWDTIMLHMRTVANLPADDARAIQAFLRAH
jgi:mono/diheme cytochrome c family protein